MKPALDFRRYVNQDDNIVQLLVITVLVFVAMAALSPDKFLRYYNFESISFTFPELGLLSIAIMVAMLTGGIDLSIIGIANLAGVLAGTLFHQLAPGASTSLGLGAVMLGVALALIVGLVAGALNGFLISRLKITPILATLGTSQIFTGLALVLTGGPAIVGFPEDWTFIGNGKRTDQRPQAGVIHRKDKLIAHCLEKKTLIRLPFSCIRVPDQQGPGRRLRFLIRKQNAERRLQAQFA